MNYIVVDNEYAYQYKFNPYYFLTETGKVYSIYVKGGQGSVNVNEPHLLSYSQDKDGYYRVVISDNSTKRYAKVHTLMVEQFIRPLTPEEVVNHIDGNIHNNNIGNLEITTPQYNTIHAHKMGLCGWDVKVNVQYNNQLYSFNSMADCIRSFPDIGIHYLHQLRENKVLFSMILFEKVYPDARISPIRAIYNGQEFAIFNTMQDADNYFGMARGSTSSTFNNNEYRRKVNKYIISFPSVSTIESVTM